MCSTLLAQQLNLFQLSFCLDVLKTPARAGAQGNSTVQPSQVSLWTKLFVLSLFKENIPDVRCSAAVKQGAECLNRSGFMAVDISSLWTDRAASGRF